MLNVASLVSGKGSVITSLGLIFMIAGFRLKGIPRVTKPAPERSAASAHKTPAPENLAEPAKINMCPKSPLWALSFLRNNCAGNRIIFYMRDGHMHIDFFARRA